jgi:hypothetical protein
MPLPGEDLDLAIDPTKKTSTGRSASRRTRSEDPRDVDPNNRRLPWTSMFSDAPPGQRSATRTTSHTQDQDQDQDQDQERNSHLEADANPVIHDRDASHESTRPLIPQPTSTSTSISLSSSKQISSPRNLLAKFTTPAAAATTAATSRARHTSLDAGERPKAGRNQSGVLDDQERWSMVDVPPHVGKLGLTMYEPKRDSRQGQGEPSTAGAELSQAGNIIGAAPTRAVDPAGEQPVTTAASRPYDYPSSRTERVIGHGHPIGIATGPTARNASIPTPVPPRPAGSSFTSGRVPLPQIQPVYNSNRPTHTHTHTHTHTQAQVSAFERDPAAQTDTTPGGMPGAFTSIREPPSRDQSDYQLHPTNRYSAS